MTARGCRRDGTGERVRKLSRERAVRALERLAREMHALADTPFGYTRSGFARGHEREQHAIACEAANRISQLLASEKKKLSEE